MFEDLASKARGALDSGDHENIRESLKQLGERGSPEQVLALFDNLTSKLTGSTDERSRAAIVQCIGTHACNGASVRERALTWVSDTLNRSREDTSHTTTRAEAAHLVGMLTNLRSAIAKELFNTIGSKLIAIAEDTLEDQDVRIHCIRSLARIDYREGLEKLIAMRVGESESELWTEIQHTVDVLSQDQRSVENRDGPPGRQIRRDSPHELGQIGEDLVELFRGILQKPTGVQLYADDILNLTKAMEQTGLTFDAESPPTQTIQIAENLRATIKCSVQNGDLLVNLRVDRPGPTEESDSRSTCDISILEFHLVQGDSKFLGIYDYDDGSVTFQVPKGTSYHLKVRYMQGDLQTEYDPQSWTYSDLRERLAEASDNHKAQFKAITAQIPDIVKRATEVPVNLGEVFNRMLQGAYVPAAFESLLKRLNIETIPSKWGELEFTKLLAHIIPPYAPEAGRILLKFGFDKNWTLADFAENLKDCSIPVRNILSIAFHRQLLEAAEIHNPAAGIFFGLSPNQDPETNRDRFIKNLSSDVPERLMGSMADDALAAAIVRAFNLPLSAD
jgi:hypothetical protein